MNFSKFFHNRIYNIVILLVTITLITGCSTKNNITTNNQTSVSKDVTPTTVTNPSSSLGENDNIITTSPDKIDDTTDKGSLAKTMTKENYPTVDGSTATIPLSAAVYRFITGATKEEADANIVHTKTTNSYLSLIDGKVDLLIVYEPSQAVYDALETSEVKLNMKPIGKDALVFLANEANPVSSLTSDELIKIYNGTITNWSKVGGSDKEIIAFQRPEDSGSQTLMKKLVMKDIKMMEAPKNMRPIEMDDIIVTLANYSNDSNALGYSVYYYTNNMFSQPGLRYMAINDVLPTKDTIQDNTYPYVNEFYAVIREDEPIDSNAHKIFDWLSSFEGQTLVDKLGYVPIK
ncbi:MAG: ABC-type phosphate transport system periplasmic component-like protein [Anaerocolumna sp.]|jgi:ABC-type phosphate transport system substrate-binding protein|nr:ABC-type phosphate transport system periplasmic component-like protein [Anaerocolumna sp.]